MSYKKMIKATGVFLLQLAAWGVFILFAPLMIYLTSGNVGDACILYNILSGTITPCMLLYFINYYLLVPYLFFGHGKKKLWFFAANIAIWGTYYLFLVVWKFFPALPYLPEGAWIGITAGAILILVLGIGSVGLALAIRNNQRTRAIKLQLNEEKRRRTEAELLWLKNQLNPHFLFNCLNNISSLVYLDADKAQDCIGRLSDLLRYAVYESEKESVALHKEIEFIRNYIELMSLRCNEKATIEFDCSIENMDMPVAPLIFISLIENAFKHGISAARESFVKISIREHDGVLTFACENSNNPKTATDRSGSGIGLVNTRKRLDMMTGADYSWDQFSDESVFKVVITIRHKK
ncbi:MAG: histidine kinase [Muribaculaceae bacterium]|nr:histidine kinase [Muribaculaceae bacterium]